MFSPPAPLLTGQSFLLALRAALDMDDAGLDSTPSSPVLSATLPLSPLTPIDSDEGSSHSMDVPRTSSPIPQSSPVDEHVALPATPSERDWSGGTSDWSTDAESDCSSDYGDASADGEFDEGDVATSLPAPVNKKKRKRAVNDLSRAANKKHRGVRRRAEVDMLGPTSKCPPTFRGVPSPFVTQLPGLSTMPVTSTGFTGKRLGSLREKHLWKLSELKSLGMAVVPWDGWYAIFACGTSPLSDAYFTTARPSPS